MPTKLLRKQFLLTDEENERIEKEAQKQNLSVSNLTRQLHGLEPLETGRRPKKNKDFKEQEEK